MLNFGQAIEAIKEGKAAQRFGWSGKGMREMNYQNTQQFERDTMMQLPIQPLLVL